MSADLGHLAHEVVHVAAALALTGGGAVFLILAARRRRSGRGPTIVPAASHDGPEAAVRQSLSQVLVALSVAAAAIHLAAAPSHYGELGDLGAGFVVAAAFQAAWARAWLRSPSRRTALLGVIGNASIILVWAWSRAIGLPIGGPLPGPETIGLPDAAATVFEVLILVGLTIRLLALDAGLERRVMAARSIAAVAVVPAVGLILLTTSFAAVAIAAGLDHGLPVGLPAPLGPHGH